MIIKRGIKYSIDKNQNVKIPNSQAVHAEITNLIIRRLLGKGQQHYEYNNKPKARL
jgi:hypothetical protein